MVDFVSAEKVFKDYLKNYDLNDGKIKLKVVHTYKVMEMSEYLAKELGLDEENVELAKLIGLLHDIGRFEQEKMFGSYVDHKTMDHADYGVKVLFEDGLIRQFIKENKYDNVIMKAISNHNKYNLEEGLSNSELLHSKIIKDADKVDNFRVKSTDNIFDIIGKAAQEITFSDISEKIYKDFMEHRLILTTNRKTAIDMWISYIAFIFDFYYTPGLKYIKEKDYINKIIDRVDYEKEDVRAKMEIIRKEANDYVDMRIKSGI